MKIKDFFNNFFEKIQVDQLYNVGTLYVTNEMGADSQYQVADVSELEDKNIACIVNYIPIGYDENLAFGIKVNNVVLFRMRYRDNRLYWSWAYQEDVQRYGMKWVIKQLNAKIREAYK